MKKILVAALGACLVLAPMQAKAGNDAALIIGGVIGGLVLGGIVHNDRVYAAPPQPVYEPEPHFRQVCEGVTVRRWDRYTQSPYYIRENRCYWVRY